MTSSSNTKPTIQLPAENASFESNIKALDTIVATLEQGDIALEESLALFEQGVQLQRRCQALLNKAEKRVEVLLEKNGEMVSEPLESTTKTPD